MLDGSTSLTPTALAEVLRVIEFGMSGNRRVLGDRVFSYAWRAVPDAPHCIVWVFIFFEKVIFLDVQDVFPGGRADGKTPAQ